MYSDQDARYSCHAVTNFKRRVVDCARNGYISGKPIAPNLSDLTAPLRVLTKKENEFIWDAVSEKAYNSMKQQLCLEPGPVIGHFGIEKTNQRACDAVYWPRLNTDIESLTAICSIWQEHRCPPQKKIMLNRPIPARPFQMVAVDLFECNDKNCLCLQDYYSRYIEVERLYSTRR